MDNNSFDKQNQNTEQGQYQQTYQQPYQQQYQQQPPYQAGDSGLEEPVSFGDWMVTMLLMWIPCVNIIMLFVSFIPYFFNALFKSAKPGSDISHPNFLIISLVILSFSATT